jgi:uncharacterized protein (DUF1684 family)
MMRGPIISRLCRPVAGAAVALLLAGCTSGPPAPNDDRPYDVKIRDLRAQKDADFRASDNAYSPIPAGERASFQGLSYYPIQPSYRLPAALHEVRSTPPVVISLPNSAHQIEQKIKVGTLAFSLDGHPYTLSAFAEQVGDVERLWVPFRDLTSGLETYGGGRYLDLERTASGTYDLDFNRAYHPFCVYNPTYECPYPPAENRLTVAIRAGERLSDPAHAP